MAVHPLRPYAIIWIGTLVLMLWTIGFAPVQRAQEARVLVSAREMLAAHRAGNGLRALLIPRANGVVRLQKPPLAYWMAAASFKVFGVHDGAGRLPFALCGWLTVVLTFHIALFAFDRNVRAAVWSAALLAGSYLFHRHARIAETDVVVTLALSVAIYAIWRGQDLTARRHILWFQVSGIAIGLAGLAKGLPALCAVLFLVASMFATRQYRVGLRWIVSGAPVLALTIGMSWWMYILTLPERGIVGHELHVLLDEPNHPGWFFIYFPLLLKASLPWTPIFVFALIDATINWRRERQVAVCLAPLLLWCGAILIPLLFLGNKQQHYLLPMMPPMALIAGWSLNRLSGKCAAQRARSTAQVILATTGVVVAIGSIFLPIIAREFRGSVLIIDWIAAIILLTAIVAVIVQMRRSIVAGFTTFCCCSAACASLIIGLWWPTTETPSPRSVATEIRNHGAGPYYFYGKNVSLPLVFNLRAIVPVVDDAQELQQLIRANPDVLIIAQTKANRAPLATPDDCEPVAEIVMRDQKFVLFRSLSADFTHKLRDRASADRFSR